MTNRIAVVGSGMVGSALVCALQQELNNSDIIWIGGVSPPVQEKHCIDPRVIACSLGSQRFFEQLGAWSLIPFDRLGPYQQMKVWDYEGTGQISFCAEDLSKQSANNSTANNSTKAPPENLGHILESSLLVEALHNRISQSATKVEKHIPDLVVDLEYTGTGEVNLTLESGLQISADMICAADGANSTLREWAQLPTRAWSCKQRALVSVIKHSKSHQQTAWQAFLPSGPLAFLPLAHPSEPNYCAIVWSIDLDKVERIEQLSDEGFIAEINRYIPQEIGQVESATARFGFALQQSLADRYFNDRIVLVGDSAHNIHPLAGQGANLGFADVEQLVAQLKRAEKRGESIWSESVLRRYQRQRRWQNQAMAFAMDAFRKGFGLSEPHLRVARNQLIHFLQGRPRLKKIFLQIAEKSFE